MDVLCVEAILKGLISLEALLKDLLSRETF